MAFEGLTEKLTNIFDSMRKKGRLTEDDVRLAMKEVKMALLEADVNFKVVKQFTKTVQEKAVGQDVMNGLNPAQMVIKIVHDEMVSLLGNEAEELKLKSAGELTIIMMIGLQGAGKTTTAAKLAGKLKAKGRKVLLKGEKEGSHLSINKRADCEGGMDGLRTTARRGSPLL